MGRLSGFKLSILDINRIASGEAETRKFDNFQGWFCIILTSDLDMNFNPSSQ